MSKYLRPDYPTNRMRRLRADAARRAMVQENHLRPDDLILPVFVTEGTMVRTPIESMPGVERLSIDLLVDTAKRAADLGIPAICLFPYVDGTLKTDGCEEAWNPDNLSNRATRAIKDAVPNILIMTDVALDPYNAKGHDGIVEDGQIVNDRSVEALVKQAVSQANAGADILGPSDMMDGRIAAIRAALEDSGKENVAILSYAAKYASAFYGPFRDAVGASGALTADKNTYQINPANAHEAMGCVARDISEGADMVMVKPGMPYLDMVQRVKSEFRVPTFAYQVSGEFAMIKAAAQNGWLDETSAMMESLIAFKRAGCDGILTYFAKDAARLLT